MCKVFLFYLTGFLFFQSTSLAQSVEELVNEGNKAFLASDYSTAVSLLEKAINKDKLLPSVVYQTLGQSYEALQQYEKAVILYTSMEDRASRSIYLELISILAEKMNRVNDACRVWNKLSQKYPNSKEVYLGIYKILLIEGDNRGAMDSLSKGMSLFTKDDFLYFYKEIYTSFLKTRAYENIVEMDNGADKNIRCDPLYYALITKIVDSLIAHKEDDLANTLIKHQSELNCVNEFKQYKIFITSFLKTKAYVSIIELDNRIDKDIRCDSSYVSFLTDIVDSLVAHKKDNLAEILVRNQRESNCFDEFQQYKILNASFLKMKAYESIVELDNGIDKKIRCDSSYFSFFTDIVDSLIAHKRDDCAKILVGQQSELNCLDEFEQYKIFNCFVALNDTNSAKESGRKLLDLKTKNENCYYEIAELEEQSGNSARTLDIMKELYTNIGGNINTRRFLDFYLTVAKKYQNEGKYQKAIEVLSEIPNKLTDDPRIDFEFAKQNYLKGDNDNTRRYAESSLGKYINQQKSSPMDANSFVNTGLCYMLMEDLIKAEGEFQKHINRADKHGKEDAIRRLRELASENINKPDAEYLLRKYYDQPSEIAIHPQVVPVEKPLIIGLMALESFTESTKINVEPDKSYVIVHSQIPNLRFDSNRKIIKVNQLTSGDWELWLPVGTHILKFDADGFLRLELPPMNFGKKRSYEIKIKVAPPDTD